MIRTQFPSHRLALATFLTLAFALYGCNNAKSTSPLPSGYRGDSIAMADARERRQEYERKKAADQEAARAEAQKREVAAATQAAVSEATSRHSAPAPSPAVSPVPRSGQVQHVVVMWLKKPGDTAARKALLAAGETFKTIPGVLDVTSGEVIPSDRAVVDSTYDVAFVVTFKDTDSLKAYGPHPVHQKVVEEVVKPNVEKYLVYDFVMP